MKRKRNKFYWLHAHVKAGRLLGFPLCCCVNYAVMQTSGLIFVYKRLFNIPLAGYQDLSKNECIGFTPCPYHAMFDNDHEKRIMSKDEFRAKLRHLASAGR